jgi:cell division septum initiation protein DivIVA
MALDHTDDGDPPTERPPDAEQPTPTDDAHVQDDATREMRAADALRGDEPGADAASGETREFAAARDADLGDARVPEFDPTRPRDDDADEARELDLDEAREVDPDPAEEARGALDEDADAPAVAEPEPRDPDATEEWAPDEEQNTSSFPAPDPELDALRDASFPVVWRGYEPQAVDAYVASVSRAVARFEERTYPTVAVQRALDRVGEQTAAILRQAEQAAEDTTRTSRAKADDRLQRAEREAADVQAGAIARVRELDDDIERLWQERQRLIDATKDLSEQLRTTALDAEARFPPADAPAPPAAPFDIEPGVTDEAEAEAEASADEDPPAAT